jgi:hypothetical protein
LQLGFSFYWRAKASQSRLQLAAQFPSKLIPLGSVDSQMPESSRRGCGQREQQKTAIQAAVVFAYARDFLEPQEHNKCGRKRNTAVRPESYERHSMRVWAAKTEAAGWPGPDAEEQDIAAQRNKLSSITDFPTRFSGRYFMICNQDAISILVIGACTDM